MPGIESLRRSRIRNYGDLQAVIHYYIPLALFLAALIIVTAGGGSNRTDVLSLLYVRPCLSLIVIAMVLRITPKALTDMRWPLGLMVMALTLTAAQLIPLPPALWTKLAGRELAVQSAAAQGIALRWRPLSLTPDLTVQSLLWFLAPIAAILGWAGLDDRQRWLAFLAVLMIAILSAALGGLQASQGSASPLYFYEYTYEGNAVGFLANRNHQGALLALTFPLLRLLTFFPARSRKSARLCNILATLGALALVPMLMLTASRAGVALGLIGVVFAALMAPWPRVRFPVIGEIRHFPMILAAGLAIGAGVVALSGRALALSRLFGSNVDEDLRVRNMPLVLNAIRHYLPFGSGMGSFDPVFRMLEPDAILKPTFYNHAHNDYLEIALTAGIPGLILMVAGIGWWLTVGATLFLRRSDRDPTTALALAGWGAMAILMLASIVDYPLRTPLLGFLFATLSCWTLSATPKRPATPLYKAPAQL